LSGIKYLKQILDFEYGLALYQIFCALVPFLDNKISDHHIFLAILDGFHLYKSGNEMDYSAFPYMEHFLQPIYERA